MAVKTSLARGLQMSIGTLWNGDCLSDFTVVVGGTSFRCHRFILSACSDYFKGLFRSEMRETQENRGILQGMTANTFDVILNSVYRGVDGLTRDNVLDVWSATVRLQIRYLTEECENFAINNASVDNCLRMLRYARLYLSEQVETSTLVFISRHFEQLSKMENFLQLSFADFYRVIESDYLIASSEDVVVETVLKWVDYTHLHSSDCTSNCKEPDNSKDLTVSYSYYSHTKISHSGSSTIAEVRRARKQHLFTYISTCRLYLISSSCLDTLLHSPTMGSCQEALNLVSDAMMYKLCVGRRHDPWPGAAVHRVTSNMKHVMVFLSNNKFMAYNLNTDSVHEFASLPAGYRSGSAFTVFDNVLYLGYAKDESEFTLFGDVERGKFHVFVNQKWERVNTIYYDMEYNRSYKLLVHDHRIFYLGTSEICYCEILPGQSRTWDLLCNMSIRGDVEMFFQQYILSFSTKPNSPVEVMCCNVETKEKGKISSTMDGTSKGMVSFTHNGDVFLLQRNGSLWKIFSTDTDLVDFELVSKLWDGDVELKGCVVYRKELFVFHRENSSIVHSVPLISLGSAPDLLIKIKMVEVNSDSSCLPMVLPQSWFIFKK